jgi:hypothetical protein
MDATVWRGYVSEVLNSGFYLCSRCDNYHRPQNLLPENALCRACSGSDPEMPLDGCGYHRIPHCQALMPQGDACFRCRVCYSIRYSMDGSVIHLINGVHFDCRML